ncbi:MAG: 1,4-dihydroxy-6-naphthoate synthase [Pirellulaceae bacterium]
MSRNIKLGISTCPNDTFAFHAIMNRAIDLQGLEFDIELLDVQQLNENLLAGCYDVAKASFHTALLLGSEIVILSSGSALGFGVGPLLLSRHKGLSPDNFRTVHSRQPVVLCPGRTTTATLLYRLAFGDDHEMKQVVFSEIMPALQAGNADYGVCIHEGRFTWQQSGLDCIADLGQWWETTTGSALPLGGIVGRRSLGDELLAKIQRIIRASIEYGLQHRDATLPTMRKYATEFGDDVLFAHVDLYVNDYTIDLGEHGRHALRVLSEMAVTMPEFADEGHSTELIEVMPG